MRVCEMGCVGWLVVSSFDRLACMHAWGWHRKRGVDDGCEPLGQSPPPKKIAKKEEQKEKNARVGSLALALLPQLPHRLLAAPAPLGAPLPLALGPGFEALLFVVVVGLFVVAGRGGGGGKKGGCLVRSVRDFCGEAATTAKDGGATSSSSPCLLRPPLTPTYSRPLTLVDEVRLLLFILLLLSCCLLLPRLWFRRARSLPAIFPFLVS